MNWPSIDLKKQKQKHIFKVDIYYPREGRATVFDMYIILTDSIHLSWCGKRGSGLGLTCGCQRSEDRRSSLLEI